MTRSCLIHGGLVVGVLATATLGAGLPARAGHDSPMARTDVAIEAPSCALIDQDGRPFVLRNLRGKAVLLTFVYTSCPDVCPLIVRAVSVVQQRVNEHGPGDLMAVFVTTDPEVDTPDVLKAYATRRGVDLSSAVFLTGSPEQLRAVWHAFGVKVTRLARGLVNHTPLTVLIDARGVIRHRYLGGILEPETLAADGRKAVSGEAATQRGRHGAR